MGLLILVFVGAGPAAALPCLNVITLNPGDPIPDNVTAVCDGGTLILNPGMYPAHHITIEKNLTVRAADGSTAADITLDGMQAGDRIFTIMSGYTLALDNLTLVNGTAEKGGAINNFGGTLSVTSVRFRDCTADNTGGAIYNLGTATITSGTFSNCSAGNGGGAIFSFGGPVTIASSTFSNLTAGDGCVIYMWWGTLAITSSSFTDCLTTTSGGPIITVNVPDVTIDRSVFSNCTGIGIGVGGFSNSTRVTLTSSTITRCSGPDLAGGFHIQAKTVTITNTTFTGCSSYTGVLQLSAVAGANIINIESSAFTDCDAAYDGGAIDARPGCHLTITGTSFTNCTSKSGGAIYIAGSPSTTTLDISGCRFVNCSVTSRGSPYSGIGGAIHNHNALMTIRSSDFTGCHAELDGGAIGDDQATGTIHYCRFSGNTAGGSGQVVYGTSVDATNNWWGTNNDPSGMVSGTVMYSPWLVLGAVADPVDISTARTSAIRMNLTYDSDGSHHDPAAGHVPDGIPGSWAIVTGSGAVVPSAGATMDSANVTTFMSIGSGATNISATVDGQTVYVGVNVSAGPTTAPTTAPVYATLAAENDDGFPTTAPTPGQAGTLPPMTVTVNIGGDSKAWQAIVTGTKLTDLIVTGTVQTGPGDNRTAPPGTVFQYISVIPARYTTITNAVIYFTVPQAWLDENHIAPGSIVLYHLTANGWEALPTTVVSSKDGTVYFSAQSTGFSLYAIAGTPSAATPITIASTQEISGTAVQTPAPAAVTKTPVTTQTTAPPAAIPQPAAPSPLLNIVFVVAAIGILAGGGFMARRWWIRRQNPALFKEYD